ncbi:hypothetical protein J6590_008491 [Homalodisca vitripennis]|nr:hypothetical protein J6590_008491 [Homalodisca vitripennis]
MAAFDSQNPRRYLKTIHLAKTDINGQNVSYILPSPINPHIDSEPRPQVQVVWPEPRPGLGGVATVGYPYRTTA